MKSIQPTTPNQEPTEVKKIRSWNKLLKKHIRQIQSEEEKRKKKNSNVIYNTKNVYYTKQDIEEFRNREHNIANYYINKEFIEEKKDRIFLFCTFTINPEYNHQEQATEEQIKDNIKLQNELYLKNMKYFNSKNSKDKIKVEFLGAKEFTEKLQIHSHYLYKVFEKDLQQFINNLLLLEKKGFFTRIEIAIRKEYKDNIKMKFCYKTIYKNTVLSKKAVDFDIKFKTGKYLYLKDLVGQEELIQTYILKYIKKNASGRNIEHLLFNSLGINKITTHKRTQKYITKERLTYHGSEISLNLVKELITDSNQHYFKKKFIKDKLDLKQYYKIITIFNDIITKDWKRLKYAHIIKENCLLENNLLSVVNHLLEFNRIRITVLNEIIYTTEEFETIVLKNKMNSKDTIDINNESVMEQDLVKILINNDNRFTPKNEQLKGLTNLITFYIGAEVTQRDILKENESKVLQMELEHCYQEDLYHMAIEMRSKEEIVF